MLEIFLKKNVNLIVSLTFFIALSDFFNNKVNTEAGMNTVINQTLQLGIVSSIIISILISFIILMRLFKDPSTNQVSLRFEFNLENIERYMFTVPFITIMLTLLYYVFHTFNLETNLIVALIAFLISVALYLRLLDYKIFNEHLYLGSFFIIVVSMIIAYYIMPYEAKNPSFIPLHFVLSPFVTLSLFILAFTFIKDMIKLIRKF